MSKPFVYLTLSQGQFAIIDVSDFEKVGIFKWFALRTPSGNFYVVRNGRLGEDRKLFYLHCEIMGVKGVDHRDGNGLDCRRKNLRPATPKQQQKAFARKRPNATSKFRGVYWHRASSKWSASISVDSKPHYIGCFRNEEDAARAYDTEAKKLGFFKEALNFTNG